MTLTSAQKTAWANTPVGQWQTAAQIMTNEKTMNILFKADKVKRKRNPDFELGGLSMNRRWLYRREE